VEMFMLGVHICVTHRNRESRKPDYIQYREG